MKYYEKLLEKARKEMPEKAASSERFEIPKVKSHIQGNRTVVDNFYQIAEVLGREPEHVIKNILKELAAPGNLTKSALIIRTKVGAERIDKAIEKYADEFVICPVCKRPDTKLIKEEGADYIRCQACGAKNVVRV